MHADGKSTLASISKWNSGKVNYQKTIFDICNLIYDQFIDDIILSYNYTMRFIGYDSIQIR